MKKNKILVVSLILVLLCLTAGSGAVALAINDCYDSENQNNLYTAEVSPLLISAEDHNVVEGALMQVNTEDEIEFVLSDEQKAYAEKLAANNKSKAEQWENKVPVENRGILGYFPSWTVHGELLNLMNKKTNVALEDLRIVDDLFGVYLPYRDYKKEDYLWGHMMTVSKKSLSDFNNDPLSPVEYIYKIDNDHVCVVYKVEGAYVYIVFESASVEPVNIPPNYPSIKAEQTILPVGYLERWITYGESYYVSGSLKSSDFDSIKLGNSIDDVIAIDPSVSKDIFGCRVPEIVEKYDDGTVLYKFERETYRLLEDGILKISFTRQFIKNDSDKTILDDTGLIVSDIAFFPYGQPNGDDGEFFNILNTKTPIPLPKA